MSINMVSKPVSIHSQPTVGSAMGPVLQLAASSAKSAQSTQPSWLASARFQVSSCPASSGSNHWQPRSRRSNQFTRPSAFKSPVPGAAQRNHPPMTAIPASCPIPISIHLLPNEEHRREQSSRLHPIVHADWLRSNVRDGYHGQEPEHGRSGGYVSLLRQWESHECDEDNQQ